MKNFLLSLCFAFFLQQCFAQCSFESIVLNPAPVSNQYAPGTIVTFCYSVDSFTQGGTNWLHGVQLIFGGGWDTSTLTVISLPVECDTFGFWGYYQSCTSSATGETFGPGFYFENSQGNINSEIDDEPGNNYGDGGTDCYSFSWTFCFSVQVSPDCVSGGDLSAIAISTGDGTTGSWNDGSCSGVPFDMVSGVTCGGCTFTASTEVTNPLCNGGTGTATATPSGGVEPYSYSWTPGEQTTATASNLTAGTYTVVITDSAGCVGTSTATIVDPPLLVANAGIDTIVCADIYYPLGGTPTATGGTPPYHYSWPEIGIDNPNPVIVASTSATYHLIVTDTNGCVMSDSVVLTVVTCTGIPGLNDLSSFSIYPNPNDGVFNITINKEIMQHHPYLVLYDLVGKEILRRKMNSEQETLNLKDLGHGVYSLAVESNEKLSMRKLVEIY